MKKTLLLNTSYEVLSFVTFKKVCKYLSKNKVEVISHWDEYIESIDNKIKYPSIIRLHINVKRNYSKVFFNRRAIVKRDRNHCQYCNKKLCSSQVTIDHILPKSKGGANSFTNCVVCCHDCNSVKGDKTLEECGFKLIRKPTHPSFTAFNHIEEHEEHWFPEWTQYLDKI